MEVCVKYGNGEKVKTYTSGHLVCVKTRIISVNSCFAC